MKQRFWFAVAQLGQWAHNDVLQRHHHIANAGADLDKWLTLQVRKLTVYAFTRATGGQGKVQQVPRRNAVPVKPDEGDGTW